MYPVCQPILGAWTRSGCLCTAWPNSRSVSPAASGETRDDDDNTSVCIADLFSVAVLFYFFVTNFVLSVGHGAVKGSLLKLQVVHV